MNEYVGDITIPTQVMKYSKNDLQADQPIRLQNSNQIKLYIVLILSVIFIRQIACIYKIYDKSYCSFIYFLKYHFYFTSDDTSCERCYTSNYCLGDGESHKCARCDNETDSCNRSISEHSFGAKSECSPCLDGWVCIQNNK